MEIVAFPGFSTSTVTKKSAQRFRFTCTTCNESTELNFGTMIFCTVDIQCSHCDTLYHITNPSIYGSSRKGPK